MIAFLNRAIYLIARLLQASYRFQHIGLENLESLRAQKKNFLLSIYHQNLLPGILAQQNDQFVVIVSKSKDAEPVAYTCTKLGHKVARGSSRRNGVDKGGRAAMEEMIGFLKEGLPGAVTVDGPKGPIYRVKPGIIEMARASESVIVPYTVRAKNFITFQSWDLFELPIPFTKIYVHYGTPIEINDLGPEKENLAAEIQKVEDAMTSSKLEVLEKWINKKN